MLDERHHAPVCATADFLAWLGAGARTVIADARRHRLVFVAFRCYLGTGADPRLHPPHADPSRPLQLDGQPPLPDRRGRSRAHAAGARRPHRLRLRWRSRGARLPRPEAMTARFFKRIAGVAGDGSPSTVATCSSTACPWAGPRPTFDRRPLDPIAPTVIRLAMSACRAPAPTASIRATAAVAWSARLTSWRRCGHCSEEETP